MSTPMTVRPATSGDVSGLARLEEQLFGADAWSAPTVERALANDRGWVTGAGPIGYAVAAVAGDIADLQRIAVDPGHRRTGVAHALLAAALAGSRTAGAERMMLEVSADNAGALAFYTGEGFQEIDRRLRYYRSGADAVVMSRVLSRPAATSRRTGWESP